MDILFIHGNYPAQFRHLAERLGQDKGHRVLYLTARKDPVPKYSGVTCQVFKEVDKSRLPDETYQRLITEHVAKGVNVREQLISVRDQGFSPRLIFFHGGNGLGLYLKNIFPQSRTIGYFEWYFTDRCAQIILGDNGIDTLSYVRTRNMVLDSELLDCTAAVCPTLWQRDQFPKSIQGKLEVIFDGIDVDFFKPPEAIIRNEEVVLEGEKESIIIRPDEKLLTYATRGMEPLRGYPQFMRLLPTLLKKNTDLKVLIGGRDRSAYGPKAPDKYSGSWKKLIEEELGDFDGQERVIYTGLLSYHNYRKMLYTTNLHCYFTQPYVTSWSLFEAAACGTPILTNKSPATNGTISIPDEYMIDNFDCITSTQTVERINLLLRSQRERKSYLSKQYFLSECMELWQNLINRVLSGLK